MPERLLEALTSLTESVDKTHYFKRNFFARGIDIEGLQGDLPLVIIAGNFRSGNHVSFWAIWGN